MRNEVGSALRNATMFSHFLCKYEAFAAEAGEVVEVLADLFSWTGVTHQTASRLGG
jgi:hypothetical protein